MCIIEQKLCITTLLLTTFCQIDLVQLKRSRSQENNHLCSIFVMAMQIILPHSLWPWSLRGSCLCHDQLLPYTLLLHPVQERHLPGGLFSGLIPEVDLSTHSPIVPASIKSQNLVKTVQPLACLELRALFEESDNVTHLDLLLAVHAILGLPSPWD